MSKPVFAGVGTSCLIGAGVIAHLRSQQVDRGAPVSYLFFEPDWLSRETLVSYYSWPFLALVAASVVLIVAGRSLRRDSAMLAVVALAVTCVLVSQLWRLHVPFEYRRVVYYLGVALVVLIGAASLRLSRRLRWIAAYGLALAYIAHVSIGLRLPERLLSEPRERSTAVPALEEFRDELDRGVRPDATLVVADRCLLFLVPYLLHRPTLVAYQEWQAGFENYLPLARKATTIVDGGPEGRRLAASLGVRYVVADPRCTPDLAESLGATVVIQNEEVVVVLLPGRA